MNRPIDRVGIALLRAGSLAANAAFVSGVAWLCGAPWPWCLVAAPLFFALFFPVCAAAPAGRPAPDTLVRIAQATAERMGVRGPVRVAVLPGVWTAAAVRQGGGYALLIGDEVEERHAEPLFAHEIAHVKAGDLIWEPFTDGPARVLSHAASECALLWIVAFPFLLLGAPLARLTELRADHLAARSLSSYPKFLQEVTSQLESRESLLYPSLKQRLRHAARDSMNGMA